jgi:dihydrofolate synthase/folylpolyglutamate synthase
MASILVDGAHNRHSAEQVLNALALFPRKRLILLFGASADKDIAGMLEVLGPASDAVVVTRSYHPRAADPHDLAGLVRTIVPTKPVFVADEALTALQMALEQTTDADLILGTGSLFLVADVRSAWCALYPEAFPASDWVHAAEPFDGSFVPMLNR